MEIQITCKPTDYKCASTDDGRLVFTFTVGDLKAPAIEAVARPCGHQTTCAQRLFINPRPGQETGRVHMDDSPGGQGF